MMEKLAMGGYGLYVWTSFALALIVIVVNEWSARRRYRNVYREVEVRIKTLEEHG